MPNVKNNILESTIREWLRGACCPNLGQKRSAKHFTLLKFTLQFIIFQMFDESNFWIPQIDFCIKVIVKDQESSLFRIDKHSFEIWNDFEVFGILTVFQRKSTDTIFDLISYIPKANWLLALCEELTAAAVLMNSFIHTRLFLAKSHMNLQTRGRR